MGSVMEVVWSITIKGQTRLPKLERTKVTICTRPTLEWDKMGVEIDYRQSSLRELDKDEGYRPND
ncbi:hypothetical protein KIN20_035081 [Parelaphostrongylus tenuis]|uniref:Uncharacterized protein n=1 Tax=Parelaphostrongylus tenuis TaxID=148309 RepID=A0AAD5RDK1_PARTN|nr:hypothetical protein KIN20_035081 [Parelaphostrongylus tenuis]